jgi:dinuclear metal center YbgI/SA1388 family protein
MKLHEITSTLESIAPKIYQESYDNSGLIVGDLSMEVTGAILCLDSTEDVVDEAIRKGANLVIAHHPIVFKGLKTFTGKNYVERTVMKAIKNDIALYAIHTNLDNVRKGVNEKIADKLGLKNKRILSAKRGFLSKLVFFCPEKDSNSVKDAVFSAGGGAIGDYDYCSYSSEGVGTFKPVRNANPVEGKLGELSTVNELRIEVLVKNSVLEDVLHALKSAHPYEEVAHEVYSIENEDEQLGSGMIGELESSVTLDEFLTYVSFTFNTGVIKYTPFEKEIKKVAVCGGSGSFLLKNAMAAKADVFITSDFKYHEFFDAEGEISIFDIGHFESEQFTIDLIKEFLIDKFPKFAPHLTEINTNPVKYF